MVGHGGKLDGRDSMAMGDSGCIDGSSGDPPESCDGCDADDDSRSSRGDKASSVTSDQPSDDVNAGTVPMGTDRKKSISCPPVSETGALPGSGRSMQPGSAAMSR